MDGVSSSIYHKLEVIQMHISSARQNGQQFFHSLVQEIQSASTATFENERVVAIQDAFRRAWRRLFEVIQEMQDAMPDVSTPVEIYERILVLLSNEMNRRCLMAGCIGFALGGAVGLALGWSLHVTPAPCTRIRGVVCFDYRGLDAVGTSDDVPMPIITSPDQVLVEVRAASVDCIDIKIASGYGRAIRHQLHKYTPHSLSELPLVLGRDCSGVVVELGHAVKQFEVGDEVWLCVPYWASGTLAQYMVANQHYIAKKPRGIGFEGAASLPYSGSIAWDAVVNKAGLSRHSARGKRVLVHCGSSPVGCIIIQLVRLWGAHVTVTCPERARFVCETLGSDDVIVFEEGPVDSQLSTREKFDYVFNTLGAAVHQSCLKFCHHEGSVVTTVATRIASDSYGFVFGALYSLYVRLKNFLMQETVAWGAVRLNSETLGHLASLVENGHLQPVVDRICAPRDSEMAFQHADSAQAVGKTVIRFSAFDDDMISTRSSTRSSRPDILS